MPELPEVEVVRRGLAQHLSNTTVLSCEVLHPRANRGQEGPLAPQLIGRHITGWNRRGKFLWAALDDGHALMVHLGMSGQMIVGDPGTATSPHIRIRVQCDNGRELCFIDQRTFGRWLLCDTDVEGTPVPAQHIALDPLDPSFNELETARKMRASKASIKSVLLNQSLISGVGNIYADESLWAAGIKPTRPAYRLRRRDILNLIAAVQEVMQRALAAGGTSFDSLYVNVNGASGYFSRSLNAYGQTGEPCARCGTPIRRVAFANRSTHYCPTCQTL